MDCTITINTAVFMFETIAFNGKTTLSSDNN